MQTLTEQELITITGGGDAFWTACGLTTGIAVGATIYFGVIGFALTVNKALATCGLAAVLR